MYILFNLVIFLSHMKSRVDLFFSEWIFLC